MAKEKIVTPVGEVKFPNLEATAVKESEDKYSIAVVFDPEATAVKEFIAKLDALVSEVKDANVTPYKDDYDMDDNGEKHKTGKVMVNFSSKYPPKIYDSANNKVDVKIGWGSKVRVAFIADKFDYKGKRGISKYLQDIQVIELKAPSDYNAFDEVDGGYVASDTEQIPF